MPNFLSSLEKDQKKIFNYKFLIILLILFVTFIIFGFLIGGLFTNSGDELGKDINDSKTAEQSNEYVGSVTYVNPNFYPGDDILYTLKDNKGKEIILLKADDQKLEVVEGLYCVVKGKVKRSEFGDYEYLMVNEVIVENESN